MQKRHTRQLAPSLYPAQMFSKLAEETIVDIFHYVGTDEDHKHAMFMACRYVNKQFARILIPEVFRVIHVKPFDHGFKKDYFKDIIEFLFVKDHIGEAVRKFIIQGPSNHSAARSTGTRGVLQSAVLSQMLSMLPRLLDLHMIDLTFVTTEVFLDGTTRDPPNSFTSLVLSHVIMDSAALYPRQSLLLPSSLQNLTIGFCMWPSLSHNIYHGYSTYPLDVTSACTYTSAPTRLFATMKMLQHLHVYHHHTKEVSKVTAAIKNNEATLETLSICLDMNGLYFTLYSPCCSTDRAVQTRTFHFSILATSYSTCVFYLQSEILQTSFAFFSRNIPTSPFPSSITKLTIALEISGMKSLNSIRDQLQGYSWAHLAAQVLQHLPNIQEVCLHISKSQILPALGEESLPFVRMFQNSFQETNVSGIVRNVYTNTDH